MGGLTMTDAAYKVMERFGEDVLQDIREFVGEQTLVIAAGDIVEVCTFLRDEPSLAYNQLADIAGIDYYPQEDPGRFAVNYHLLSLKNKHRLRLKVYWSEGEPPVPSVCGVWPGANWEEREAYDMFGILFADHPDLRRILMPDDWQGHPQRKDYPLGYETVQFSFNFDEVDKHKPYAKE